MDGSGASGNKVFGRFTEPAHQVLDLAREEAGRAGHRYLGPEHVLLGLLAEGHSRAAQLLRTAGVELAAVRRRGPATASCWARWASTWTLSATRPSSASASRRWARRPGGSPAGAGGGAPGWCGRRCAVRRWSPSGPCSWPASRRTLLVTARSGPSTCCWECWRTPGSRRTSPRAPAGTGRSSRTSDCPMATTARAGRSPPALRSTSAACGRPSPPS